MKKIIFLLIIIPFTCFAQKKDSAPIYAIEVMDSNIYNLLDSVLKMDKNCNYFSDSLCYFVNIKYSTMYFDKPLYTIIFEGNPNISSFFATKGMYTGAIKHNRHYFFIYEYSDIEKNMFILTNKKYMFDAKLRGIYPISEDDSWAMRVFLYHDGQFYYLTSANEKTRCKD